TVLFVPETRGTELESAIDDLKDGEMLLFENTRFEDVDGKKESGNDADLGKYWAGLGDVFVNDAFGTRSEEHTSELQSRFDVVCLHLPSLPTRRSSDLTVLFVPETRGTELESAIDDLKDGEMLLFENTRFEDVDGKKESGNDADLGKYWAGLGDVFVNDAFGT